MTSEEIESQFLKIIFQGISNIKKKTSKTSDQPKDQNFEWRNGREELYLVEYNKL